MKILIVNGPNLNLLGTREPGIYGSSSFEQYLPKLQAKYPDVDIEYYQSNIEGELINKMQEVGFSYDGIVLNAGAYTHTSVALHDCIRSLGRPMPASSSRPKGSRPTTLKAASLHGIVLTSNRRLPSAIIT